MLSVSHPLQAGIAATRWAVEFEQPMAEAFQVNNPAAAVFCDDCNVILTVRFQVAGWRAGRWSCRPSRVELQALTQAALTLAPCLAITHRRRWPRLVRRMTATRAAQLWRLQTVRSCVLKAGCNAVCTPHTKSECVSPPLAPPPARTVLSAALPAHQKEQLPRPGEVEFIMGGPPCQGFSGMNRCVRDVW
jgi:hypothetical protein